jgi:isoleucyl-tRNA synthetase
MVNDLVLDKNGQKMSKSRGNTVNPWELLEKYGADATRWYLLAVSPPWTPTRFDEDGVKEVFAKFFGTLQNVYSFFTLYANIDQADPESYDVPVAQREEIDRWVLSRLHSLIKQVRAEMEEFELTRVVRAIQAFVIDDVSNWYVRRTRERFWAAEMNINKKAVYRTLWEVLVTVAKLMAPFAPFMAEEIYSNLKQGPEKQVTVHLELYPEADGSLINPDLEEHMGLVIELVSLGRAARNKVQIKVRQPLSILKVDQKCREILAPMEGLVKEELNVKNLEYVGNPDDYVSYTVKPNFPVLGPKYGKMMKGIAGELSKGSAGDFVRSLRENGELKLIVDGQEIALQEEDLEIRVEQKEGFVVEMDRSNYVVLDTTLTSELIQEGLAREIVSKVQNMRKNAGLELTDRIYLDYVADDEVATAVDNFAAYIRDETLAVSLNKQEAAGQDYEAWEINGHPASLRIKKA